MKIYSITPNKFDRNIQQNNNITKNSINTNREEIKNSNLPSTQQYLAFTGGYSLDLAKTIERLDKICRRATNNKENKKWNIPDNWVKKYM